MIQQQVTIFAGLPCAGWMTMVNEFRMVRDLLRMAKKTKCNCGNCEDIEERFKRVYRSRRDAFRRHLCN
jgi:hypothetical protein